MTPSQTLTLAGVPESLYSEAIAAQAGITLPAGTITTLFAAIDVTEQEPFTAMAKMYSHAQFEQACRAIVRCATDAMRGELEAA